MTALIENVSLGRVDALVNFVLSFAALGAGDDGKPLFVVQVQPLDDLIQGSPAADAEHALTVYLTGFVAG
jgi:hypothetical protein